ncbi:MAG: PhoH family protein [Pseudomonadota bacterium]
MPTAAAGDNPLPDVLDETIVEFADNRLLIDLCGQFDRNLTQLEQGFGLSILRRGNLLTMHGPEDGREQCRLALEAIYERLEDGRPVEPADIDGLIRMGVLPDETVAPTEQLDMFPSGKLEIRTRKKTISPRSPTQSAYVAELFNKNMVFGIGPAGTGKTYLAVAAAVSMFMDGRVDKIILSRPAVEAGERLGFLPGTEKDKMDPYMRPLYDALGDMLPGKQVAKLMEDGKIEIAPLAFMRGRTLSNAFVVLDEAQNTTEMQMKMFLTRMGEGSHMAITGDPSQIDLPRGTRSGMVQAVEILGRIKEIGFIRFTATDVVRHPLVAAIVEAYDQKSSV